MSERLTFYDEFNNPCYRTKQYSSVHMKDVETVVSNSDVARKLAHFEELAEQKRLIILPPDYLQIYEKIGDSVYEIITDDTEPSECVLVSIELSETDVHAILVDSEGDISPVMDSDGYYVDVEYKPRVLTVSLDCFGKTVFLTRESAEQALQAVQND